MKHFNGKCLKPNGINVGKNEIENVDVSTTTVAPKHPA